MKNEPIAWIAVGDNTSVFFDLDCALSIDDNPTPLYTHPTKDNYRETHEGFSTIIDAIHPAKTLTDEEIAEVFDNTFKVRDFDDAFLKFARAILRKAQEK